MSEGPRINGVPAEARADLGPILDQSFKGIYRWHSRRTLRAVQCVREATQGDTRMGLAMLTLLGQDSGYIYYIAVTPSHRAMGVGGALLDDALEQLRTFGAREIFAAVRTGNLPSIRLLLSRHFAKTCYRELVQSKGFARATRLWMQMVIAPGEKVFRMVPRP
jgi:ribosomal protein S18 acetylase RimI-like enzyme